MHKGTLNLRASRREFFANFAQPKGFDVKIDENWYLQLKDDISVMEVQQKIRRRGEVEEEEKGEVQIKYPLSFTHLF